MWHEMLVEDIPLAEKIARTVLVYALLMVLFRLTGKRGLAAMMWFPRNRGGFPMPLPAWSWIP